MSGRKGRSLALQDIAGYLVAAKALANTPAYQKMVESGAIDRSFLPLIANADLGTTDRDILFKSYEWRLNTPEALKLSYRGDMDIIS